jgi:4-hydroxy-tetrahydrodipicolinate synthase
VTVRLAGVVPANLLPLDKDLAIDEAGYRAHLEHLVRVDGVGGVTCNGHAAEVSSLSRNERARALAIAVETVAGRVPVVSGVFADDERDAVPLVHDAEREGADALLLFPPNSMLYDDDRFAPYRYFSTVAASTSLPIVAFMYPRFTGMQYSTEVLTRICSIDSVIAVKEWSLDIGLYERNLEVVRSASHPVSLLTSFSTHLLPSLAVGADGILSGHGSVIAHLQAELFAATAAGDLFRAREVYARVQRLTEVVYRDPMPNMYARMKEQLVMLGFPVQTYVRPPLRPVDEAERESLRQALVDAGQLEPVAR